MEIIGNLGTKFNLILKEYYEIIHTMYSSYW